jgi:hypothetical protein
VVSRVRADMSVSAKGLMPLSMSMARSLMGVEQADAVGRLRVRAGADPCPAGAGFLFSDALAQVNKRSDREYQIRLELTPLDDALSRARVTADELAAVRSR